MFYPYESRDGWIESSKEGREPTGKVVECLPWIEKRDLSESLVTFQSVRRCTNELNWRRDNGQTEPSVKRRTRGERRLESPRLKVLFASKGNEVYNLGSVRVSLVSWTLWSDSVKGFVEQTITSGQSVRSRCLHKPLGLLCYTNVYEQFKAL